MNQTPSPADSPDAAPGGAGPSRRSLLAGATGGVAAAAFFGLAGPAHAAPGSSAAGDGRPARGARGGSPDDPHAFSGRTKPAAGPVALAAAGPADIRILPIDRAKFLAGSRFDLRVEVSPVGTADRIDIAVVDDRGRPAPVLVGEPESSNDGGPESREITYRQISYPDAGSYRVQVRVTGGGETSSAEVRHEVVLARAGSRPAKNVIFFLGDGMGQAPITAARILSKGITEGKYNGLLEMDTMEFRGLVGTSGADALATDSANSMSAYTCGHKSSVNAMGVYEANIADPNLHPRVENITELLKRTRGMSVGVVTTAEVQDATPAAVWAHTRRRNQYAEIMRQALNPEQQPDVILGGGRATVVREGLQDEFEEAGFTYVTSADELRKTLADGTPDKLLGLFSDGNLPVYLDRGHLKSREEQEVPGLVEMTEAALSVLRQNRNGFFLMVEAASIDKMEHPLDGPRAVYDTIELDQALGVAKRFAAEHGDTLVVVTADHNHSMSIPGTHDTRVTGQPDRNANGVYGDATFPTYADEDGDGFPENPDPEVQLFFGWSNHPDHRDDFEHNDTFASPTSPQRDPAAVLQVGNLPEGSTTCVHTVEDVNVFAYGPGAARFNGFLDNTEVYFGMVEALNLGREAVVADSRRNG